MRMWMVNPKIMCNQHLLGEHVELHMIISNIRLKKSLTGWINNNCIEPLLIIIRHCNIADEMIRRGFTHQSPCDLRIDELEYLPFNEINAQVNDIASFRELLHRCPKCRKRAKQFFQNIES